MKKNVLVAPLNWGLGHASRCVPIIHELLDAGHHVILASDGDAKRFLETEFPDLLVKSLPSYKVTYPRNGMFFLGQIILKTPNILTAINAEKKLLSKWVGVYQLDVVISDNRYGMYSPKIKSIIVSHQIRLHLPFFESLIANHIQNRLKRFTQIWVPDVAGELNLSGKLSHQDVDKIQPSFIGILSRMSNARSKKPNQFPFAKGFVLAVISGPEPQRTLFEKSLMSSFLEWDSDVVIVGGKPDGVTENKPTQIHYIPFANTSELKWLLENSSAVITRAGYSSIMDLITLKRKAILVPTPGQTEQEYLAKYLMKYDLFITRRQTELNILDTLHALEKLEWNSALEGLNKKQELKGLISKI